MDNVPCPYGIVVGLNNLRQEKRMTVSLKNAVDILLSGDCPRLLTPTEQEFILLCLAKHAESADKIGCGVAHIYIDHALYGQRCFYIERMDGTKIDFSIHKCFRPSKSKPEALFKQAAREAAEIPVVAGFHMHHEEPFTFERIVQDFLRDENIKPIAILYDRSGLGVRFTDVELRQKFKEYHDKRAVLVPITIDEHYEKHHGKKT